MTVKIEIYADTAEAAQLEMRALLHGRFMPGDTLQTADGGTGTVVETDVGPEVIDCRDKTPEEVRAIMTQPAAKRTRRTKAEMEAAAQPAPETAPAAEASKPEAPKPEADPLAIPGFLKREAPKPDAAAASLTVEDVRAAMTKVLEARGAPAVREILGAFVTAESITVLKVSQLREQDYAAAIAKCQEIAA